MPKKSVLIWAFLWVGFMACGSSDRGTEADWDPGPPQRALFVEFEGLKWGMTPEEIKTEWGVPDEDSTYQMTYSNKAGYARANLYFMSIPAFRNVHEDAERSGPSDEPFYFLSSVYLEPDFEDVRPKDTVRSELVERFGEPLTEPALFQAQNLNPEYSEIFRAAECTLCIAGWAPASEDMGRPENLRHLIYKLAPDSLLTEIPRSRWQDLRGSIPERAPADIKARLEKLDRIEGGASLKQILEIAGPPNIFLEGSPGSGKLCYFWLTGTNLIFNITEGRKDGHTWTFYEEDLR